MRVMLLAAALQAGCYASRDPATDEPGCDAPSVAMCELTDVWVFPGLACGMDHTQALGLCPDGKAVLTSAPREMGGLGNFSEGTWTSVISPNLVAVDLPDGELRLEWAQDEDTLQWPNESTCREEVGYRVSDERLSWPGELEWARDLCGG